MKKYKPLTDKKITELAKSPKCEYHWIMKWYADAEGVQERVDMMKLMKARMQVCIDLGKVF